MIFFLSFCFTFLEEFVVYYYLLHSFSRNLLHKFNMLPMSILFEVCWTLITITNALCINYCFQALKNYLRVFLQKKYEFPLDFKKLTPPTTPWRLLYYFLMIQEILINNNFHTIYVFLQFEYLYDKIAVTHNLQHPVYRVYVSLYFRKY